MASTTNVLPLTTASRVCRYEKIKSLDIQATNFAKDLTIIQNANVELDQSVHLLGDVVFCQGVCEQSFLAEGPLTGYECWAFTFNDVDKCNLYYYTSPLQVIDPSIFSNNSETILYLKRCSDDPPTTMVPTEATTTQPMPSTTITHVTDTVPDETTTEMATAVFTTTDDNQSGTSTSALTSTLAASTTVNVAVTTATTPTAAVTTGAIINSGRPDVSGLTPVSANTYQLTGVPSPAPGMCFFLNNTYKMGDHWNDTCKYDCECVDTTSNTALCQDVCPHFDSIRAGCQIVKDDGDCCARLDCVNGTNVNSTVSPTANCVDNLPTCDYYGDDACMGSFEPWAKANCALRCGFCDNQPPCLDRLSYCSLYDMVNDCAQYEGWARHNCRSSCNLCSVPTHSTAAFAVTNMTTSAVETSPPTPPATTVASKTTLAAATVQTGVPGGFAPSVLAPQRLVVVNANTYKMNGGLSPVADTCYFLNNTYKSGEHWNDTCKYDCECIDTSSNTALCHNVCPYYNSIPVGCQIVKDDGDCCARLDCVNGTDVNSTVSPTANCVDKRQNCDYYGDNACVDAFEPWAKANCALRCGFCDYQPPCLDLLSFCSLYDLPNDCVNYEGWARRNCKSSCNLCAVPTHNTTTAP
ncbi:uncharacterized protein LOC128219723 isoform X2 [Mya arenaria]|uniref:uncharacterized protein LOC128219723 isoform X2 n=1 Tax=Mya arenaria TaxID=6604 RepID=UPI0022E083C9|nr:uncharacterized protein LOC128219723 isoform X2 [Mya arenaria]